MVVVKLVAKLEDLVVSHLKWTANFPLWPSQKLCCQNVHATSLSSLLLEVQSFKGSARKLRLYNQPSWLQSLILHSLKFANPTAVPAKVRLTHHTPISRRTEPSQLLEAFQLLNNSKFKRAVRLARTQKEDHRRILLARLTMLMVVLLLLNAWMLLFAPSKEQLQPLKVQESTLMQRKVLECGVPVDYWQWKT